MAELGRFARELRARLWKPSVDEEVSTELAHHIELMEHDLVAQGLSPDEARTRARARFGDVARIEADCRDIGERRDRERVRARWLAELAQDVRLALRQLRASPRFAAVAIVTLAVGLGAATTIFGIADAVLLRPLPFREPGRLVVATERTPADEPFSISEPNYLDLAARTRYVSGIAGYQTVRPNADGDAGPEQMPGARVAHTLFGVLGVAPALGRVFSAEEDAAGGDRAVAIVSDALWRRRFGADPRVLDRTIDLDGTRYRIVGVMPRGFDFPYQSEVWTPLAPSSSYRRSDRRLDGAVARLAPNATFAQVDGELARVAKLLATEYPESNAGWSARAQPFSELYVTGDVRGRVITLLATVGLLLAMACVNVASLLLARAGARERQMAVRAALGASRGRIIRQLLTESLVLSLLGGAVGVALAAAAVPIVRRTGSAAVPLLAGMRLDWRVLGFCLAACMVTGVLFGLAPALRLARTGRARNESGGGLHALLRSGTRIAGGTRVRNALVVTSVALATLMLVGAGLVGSSFVRLMRVDLGFATEQVITGSIVLPGPRYDQNENPVRIIDFYDRLSERVRTLPGVRAVGAVNIAPFSGGNTAQGWAVLGREPATRAEYAVASWRVVTPGAFAALGIRLLRGRVFDGTDVGTGRRVFVISESLARLGWPNEDPIGRLLRLGNGNSGTVVGVVGDTRLLNVDSTAAPTIYYAQGQFGWPAMWLAVRTTGDPAALGAAIRREVAALDPTVPIGRVQPLGQLVADATAQPRLTVLVFAIFATAALTLAAVGLYGLVSFGVAQRTREIGVQLALGAEPGRVVRAVVGQGVGLAAAGVALGLVGAYLGGGVLRAILFEVEPTNPVTFAAVAALLLGVAALASAGPARRAARVDPALTLRSE